MVTGRTKKLLLGGRGSNKATLLNSLIRQLRHSIIFLETQAEFHLTQMFVCSFSGLYSSVTCDHELSDRLKVVRGVESKLPNTKS